MKILKKILLVVVAIIVFLLIVALFTKKDYAVEREIVINKPKQQVFEYIKYLKNQDHYSVWAMIDPNMKKDYKGTDGTIGFVSAWDSEKMGKGEQEIIAIKEGDQVDFDLHFIKPMDSKAKASMSTSAVSDNQTKVKWDFSSRMPYPMNIMMVFMDMDKMLGDDLQTGLNNLKGVLEKQ
jgi:uncharacterized membrane protein